MFAKEIYQKFVDAYLVNLGFLPLLQGPLTNEENAKKKPTQKHLHKLLSLVDQQLKVTFLYFF